MDRFDLEQQIMKCWQVTDDIDELYKMVGDSVEFAGMKPRHEDTIMNYLLGLKTIYDCKFNSLWRTFERLLEEEVIR